MVDTAHFCNVQLSEEDWGQLKGPMKRKLERL